MLLMVLSSLLPVQDCSLFFPSYTFSLAEGLIFFLKKLLLAVCQKIFKSYKSIFVSLDCKDCKEYFA